MIVHRGKTYKDEAELIVALEAENKVLSERVQLAIIGLELLEQNCPCGARPESLSTHPHVTCCLVEVTLRKIRANAPVGQGPARTL